MVSLHNDVLLTYCLIDPVGEVLLQREQLPRLRVQDLLPVEVLVLRARRLRRQRTVRALEAAAHLPIHYYVSMTDMAFLFFFPPFERAPNILEGIGPLKGIKYSVKVAAQGPVEALGLHRGRRGDRPPRRAAPDGRRTAPVVRHCQGFPATRTTQL